jgi:hypothetical protein
MSLNRKGTWLAALLIGWLAGAPASAQGLRDADLFAPAEPAHYGGGVRANQGFFFTYDALYWTISPPQRSFFGINTATLDNVRNVWWANDPNQTFTQGTTMDTSAFQSFFTPGQRIEVGHIHEHAGWLFSYMRLHELSQGQTLPGVQAFFNDQEWGVNNLPHLTHDVGGGNLVPAPVWFDFVIMDLSTKVWGTEFNLLLRTHPRQHGGMWEWFFGARYIEYEEQFDINANGTPPVSSLADTVFTNLANNNIFGPQIGLRWFTTNDRWQFSAEGKFLAGWNAQTVRLHGVVGSDLTPTNFPRGNGSPGFLIAMPPTNADYISHMSVFSPVVEVRVEGKYQLTRNVAFRAGWNGMYIGEIARPSRMVNYELAQTHVLGILRYMNRDLAFLQGLGIGIEINR